jgi:hypothetical protein
MTHRDSSLAQRLTGAGPRLAGVTRGVAPAAMRRAVRTSTREAVNAIAGRLGKREGRSTCR